MRWANFRLKFKKKKNVLNIIEGFVVNIKETKCKYCEIFQTLPTSLSFEIFSYLHHLYKHFYVHKPHLDKNKATKSK